MVSCILRDVPSYVGKFLNHPIKYELTFTLKTAQFVTYEQMKKFFIDRRHRATGDNFIKKSELLISGATAGLMAWVVSYPFVKFTAVLIITSLALNRIRSNRSLSLRWKLTPKSANSSQSSRMVASATAQNTSTARLAFWVYSEGSRQSYSGLPTQTPWLS